MKPYMPYSCCEIERYEESEQMSSPVKEREKPQMNFIKDTKGSTWDKYVGINCRKVLYHVFRTCWIIQGQAIDPWETTRLTPPLCGFMFVMTWKDTEMFYSGFWENTQEFSVWFS